MAGIKDIKLKPKLIAAFLLAGLIPLFIVAFISMNKAEGELMAQSFDQLRSVQQIKKTQVKNFFGERLGDAAVLADNPYTKMAVLELSRAAEAARAKGLSGLGLLQDPDFKAVHDTYHPTLKYYSDTYGYYDLFLINADNGDVFYSVAKEPDFGTLLSQENHHLARCWKEAISTGQAALSDMESYAPSAGAPAMFVATRVVDSGQTIGVVALQISNEAINAIMQERAGMGETGETYLVGSDKRMRSDSYLDPTGHSVAASFKGTVQNNGVDTDASNNGIAGKADAEIIIDYNGNPVLSAYDPLDLTGDIRWVVIAEIDEAEVKEPIIALRNSIIVIGIILAVIVGLFALWMAVSIAKPVARVTEVANCIAVGDLNQDIDIRQKDEIGQLADAFRDMGEALKAKAEAAEQIAKGNLSVEVKVASDDDTLGHSMTNMIRSLKAMNVEVGSLTQAALKGELDTRADASKHNGDYGKIVGGINDLLNAVVTPIQEAAKVLEAAAGKDLTNRVRGDYKGQLEDFKDNINATIEALDGALIQVSEGVEQVASASGQISSGSQALAEGANEQASSLEEVSASLEEMSSMTKQNADNANQAKALTSGARESADKGNKAMVEMSEAIEKIKVSSDETAKIVKTIDEIAFQTNLLALNAAVEAARAGEAGKGFAVVAEEVRNLAQRSAEAAKNTADMIEESVKNAEGGVKITEEVAQSLEEIATGSDKVNDLVSEIAAAAAEQSQGIEQVNTAVSQMDKVTQSNASNSEESASAAEELNSQAEELKNMVGEFKLTSSERAVQPKVVKAKGLVPQKQVGTPVKAEGLKGRVHAMVAHDTETDNADQWRKKATGVKTKKGDGNGEKGHKPDQIIPLDDMELSDF